MQSERPRGTALHWGVDGDPELPVVWFVGDLDTAGATLLTRTLTAALGEQPRALVVDINHTRLTDPLALGSLITLSHRAAAWPGCRLAVCTRDRTANVALRQLGVERHLTLARDRTTALARLVDLGSPPTVHETLPTTLASVEVARYLAREACARWLLDEIAGDAQAVISELVAHALVGAGPRIDVRLTRTERMLHLAVRDGRRLPNSSDGSPPMVDAFADRWGADVSAAGKIVWATVRRPYGP
jgi:anti-anti-sigma regulatory factor